LNSIPTPVLANEPLSLVQYQPLIPADESISKLVRDPALGIPSCPVAN